MVSVETFLPSLFKYLEIEVEEKVEPICDVIRALRHCNVSVSRILLRLMISFNSTELNKSVKYC